MGERDMLPIALQADFDSPEDVSMVYAEPHVSDGAGEFTELNEMYGGEYCERADPREVPTHIYLDGSNRCARCGMEAPWVRRNQCREL